MYCIERPMLNSDRFVLLAGVPFTWDAALLACPIRDLPALMDRQFRKGRRTAVLERTPDGWCVRSGSGLESFRVLHSEVRTARGSRPLTRDEAVLWWSRWALQDPLRREFVALRADVPGLSVDPAPREACGVHGKDTHSPNDPIRDRGSRVQRPRR